MNFTYFYLPRILAVAIIIHIIHIVHIFGKWRIYGVFRQIDYFFLRGVML